MRYHKGEKDEEIAHLVKLGVGARDQWNHILTMTQKPAVLNISLYNISHNRKLMTVQFYCLAHKQFI